MAQVSLNTRITPETNDRLDNYCRQTGKSKARITEEALKKFLDEEEKKLKKGIDMQASKDL